MARRNAGTDAAPSNLFTDGNPNTSTPASVLGSDWLNILQEEIAEVVEAAGLTVDQANPFATNDTTQLRQAIQLLGGAGGGGGFRFTPVEGMAPAEEFEYGDLVYVFSPGNNEQKIQAYLKVPQGYTVGKQIKMYLALYSLSASGTMLFRSTTTLIKKNSTAMDSTTNQHVSTNVALTNSVAKQYRETLLDLTEADGEINAVDVEPGDLLKIELYRLTDTDTTDVRVVPNAAEPKFT